jgi:hypothetical protein
MNAEPLNIEKICEAMMKPEFRRGSAATHYVCVGEGCDHYAKLVEHAPQGIAFQALHRAFIAGAEFQAKMDADKNK